MYFCRSEVIVLEVQICSNFYQEVWTSKVFQINKQGSYNYLFGLYSKYW